MRTEELVTHFAPVLPGSPRSDELRTARRPEAASALEQAIQLYEQKGNVISAARARARLKELAYVTQ